MAGQRGNPEGLIKLIFLVLLLALIGYMVYIFVFSDAPRY